MVQLVVSLVLLIMLLTFYLYGCAYLIFVDIKITFAQSIIVGTFIFFSAFSIIYLFCLFFGYGLDGVFRLFLLMWICMILGSIYYIKVNRIQITEITSVRNNILTVFILVLLSMVLVYYSVRVTYYGWDTAYYTKEISRAVKFGTLYKEWSPQQTNTSLHLKYALCSYYMFLAVLAKISSSPAILVARIVGGGACVILSILSVYCLAKEIFDSDKLALEITIVWNVLNYFLISIYTSGAFLMERSYEGKAWCGNVIIPTIIWVFFHLYKFPKDYKWWTIAFLICLSCDSISMSMLISAPVMVTIFSALLLISSKELHIIKRWFLCMMPLCFYCAVIALESKGVFSIMP